MPYPDKFQGFAVHDHKNWSDFKKFEFEPKTMGDYDMDIKIHACGICGSDVHTITAGWGEANLPLVVGHEIVGEVVAVGSKVDKAKKGDRVGVGAQVWADLTCDICKQDNENYCPNQVDTYNAPYPKEEGGQMAHGGYSNYVRANQKFVFQIPKEIPTSLAAPMLCAGLTTYAPLSKAGCGPGKQVAIIGLGGLGHFGTMWASAMGAETTVISHTADKENDAKKLGAKHFVNTSNKDWDKDLKFKFDIVINTADMTHKFDMPQYLGICKVGGIFNNCGLPDYPLNDFDIKTALVPNGVHMTANHLGNEAEMNAMLQLAAKQNLKSWVEELPLTEAGCKEGVTRLKNNDNVRYRFVLTGFDKAFPEDWK